MRGRTSLIVASVLAVIAAPAAAAPKTTPTEAIREIEAELVAAARARDIDRLASHYAPDAEIISPGEVIHGRAELLAHLQPLKTAARLEIDRKPDRIVASSDIAYVSGRYGNVFQAAGSARADTVNGTYVTVYQRDDAGKWLISIDMTAPAPR